MYAECRGNSERQLFVQENNMRTREGFCKRFHLLHSSGNGGLMRLIILPGLFRGSLSLQGVLLRYNLECCSGRNRSWTTACSVKKCPVREPRYTQTANGLRQHITCKCLSAKCRRETGGHGCLAGWRPLHPSCQGHVAHRAAQRACHCDERVK